MKRILTLITALLFVSLADAVAQTSEPVHDIVIYGDSFGAVTAAISAKREGRSVVWVNPTGFPGGMSASGLGATDFLGKQGTFGGIAKGVIEILSFLGAHLILAIDLQPLCTIFPVDGDVFLVSQDAMFPFPIPPFQRIEKRDVATFSNHAAPRFVERVYDLRLVWAFEDARRKAALARDSRELGDRIC